MTKAIEEVKRFEALFQEDIAGYLKEIGRVDEHLPEAPDIEALWEKIGETYLPDAMREFNQYPTVALGWIMYVGMAIAKYWDEDWALYSKLENPYQYLRDKIDFDHMDDYIREKVLLLAPHDTASLEKVVGECAARLNSKLLHLHLVPGSPEAFYAFISALHVMYLMGAAIQLRQMGYHMRKM